MTAAYGSKPGGPEPEILPQAAILRVLTRLGLLPPPVKPASMLDLAARIEALAATRLRTLVLPADVKALYLERTLANRQMMMAAWTMAVGVLNLPIGFFDFGILPWPILRNVLLLRASVTLMYLLCAVMLSRRRLPGLEGLMITLPCVLTVAAAGEIGLITGSADLFRNNITMSVLVAITGIIFAQVELKTSIWMAVLSLMVMTGFVANSPMRNLAEQAQLVVFYSSVMAAVVYGNYVLGLYRLRVFLLQAREELRSSAAARRNEQLTSIAYTDRLTDIPNRRYFDEIAEAYEAAPAALMPLAVCMMDIDHFKNLNDRLGHLQGDRCLRVVATAIRNHLRHQGDIVARFGGEEFVLLLPNTGAEQALEIAERIRLAVASLNHPNPGTELEHVTISAGVAVTAAPVAMEALLAAADKAMYGAKTGGRNQVVVNA
jgi:diguanylate cyclase (GGDEF)-like protein